MVLWPGMCLARPGFYYATAVPFCYMCNFIYTEFDCVCQLQTILHVSEWILALKILFSCDPTSHFKKTSNQEPQA